MRSRWFKHAIAPALVLSACGGTDAAVTTSTTPSTTTTSTIADAIFTPQPGAGAPVVVDYNPTSSDAAALLFLLQHDGVRVDAITIPGTGESHCESAVANTLGLLALVGKEGIPVACGSERPIAGSNDWPADWRAAADELPGLALTAPGEPWPLSGPELLVAAVTQSPEPVKLLTLGPLTNVAEALALDPTLVTNLEAVYVMGGAVEAGGNVFANQYAEWNIWIDPAAAQVLIESGAPIVLVPLDATNDAPVTVGWVEQLGETLATPAADAVFDLFSASPGVLQGGFYFWDELAAAVLTDHTYVTLADATLTVVPDGPEQGWTKPDPDWIPVQVAVAADSFRLERDLISVLNGEGPLEVVAADPQLVAYFTELAEIDAVLQTTLDQWFRDNEEAVDVLFEPESADVEQVKEVLGSFTAMIMDGLRNDRDLTGAVVVPTVAAEAHQAYLEAVDAVLSREDEIFADIEALGPDDQEEVLGSALFEAIGGVESACLDLHALAGREGIGVDLVCTGE